MRTLLALLTLLALPSAALAQMAPPARGPMQPFSANGNPQGITVTGQASKRVPATNARLMLQFYSQNGPAIKTAAQVDETTLQPIVDALVKVGVPRENISFPTAIQGNANANNATIVATVANPTAAQVQNGIATLATTMVGLRGIYLGNAQVTLEANCGTVADTLRTTAIANARAKANAIAKELGVRVGPVVNVAVNEAQTQNGTCSWPYYLGQGQMPQLTSPDDYVSVPVNSFITITYAIKP